MKRFPSEFEALLSSSGRRLLHGRHAARGALLRAPFFTTTGLLDERQLSPCRALLARSFTELLIEQTRRLPPANSATQPNADLLPKVACMQTVTPATRVDMPEYQRSVECGLVAMLESASFSAFAEALAGEPLDGLQGGQVLCYRPGDYAGPHADHHPHRPRAKDGYVDVHLTFSTPGVREQLIVYERDGHLTEQRSIAASGTVTAYRLPIWHYTTPLQARRPSDRRWLVLGTFFFKPPT
jgi:hypothetical protein